MRTRTDRPHGRPGLRRIARAARACVIGLVVVLVLNGAARKPKVTKGAWFNARGALTFPLGDGAFPETADELAFSLFQGWGRTPLALARGRDAIAADGAPPAVRSLRIDLSDSAVDSKRKSERLERRSPVERSVSVGRLELVGDGIRVDRSRLNLGVTADDVRLDLRRDKRGNPLLTMADARSGELTFSVTTADVERMILAAARADAGKLGLNVQSVRLAVVADDPRTLRGTLRVFSKFAFVGAGMTFTARVAIDDDMNARLTNLTCTGDDVLGPIIVGMMRPALAKYDNRAKPIVSFPGGQMKLRDLQVQVDDAIRVKAVFGRT